MKALKVLTTIGIIAGCLFVCFLLYKAFFVSSPDVQAIEKKHQEDIKQYEEKMKQHEAEKEKLKKDYEEIEAENIEKEQKLITAEADRETWKKKYTNIRKPVPTETLKTLEECKKNHETVSNDLAICQVQVEKTEFSLDLCRKLNRIKDEKIGNLNLFIKEQKKEIETKNTLITQKEVDYKLLINKKEPFLNLTGGLLLMYYAPDKRVYFGFGVCLGINFLRFLRF